MTRNHITAYLALSIRYRHDPAWIRALVRGWENLARREWRWDGSVLRVQSTSNPQIRYTVTAYGCGCHAGSKALLCDHMTSWWLCHEADRVGRRAERRSKHVDVDAAVAELF